MGAGLGGPARPRTTGSLTRERGGTSRRTAGLSCYLCMYRATAADGRYPVRPVPVQVQRRLCVFARAGCRSSVAVLSVAGCRGPIFPSEWMMRSLRSSLRSLASQQMALARPLGVQASQRSAGVNLGAVAAAVQPPGWPGMYGDMTRPCNAWRRASALRHVRCVPVTSHSVASHGRRRGRWARSREPRSPEPWAPCLIRVQSQAGVWRDWQRHTTSKKQREKKARQ